MRRDIAMLRGLASFAIRLIERIRDKHHVGGADVHLELAAFHEIALAFRQYFAREYAAVAKDNDSLRRPGIRGRTHRKLCACVHARHEGCRKSDDQQIPAN
jgi:hypothetical protein